MPIPPAKISRCNPVFSLKQSARFRYRLGFVRNGRRHFVTPWVANLIQDCGLDAIGSTFSWADAFRWCLFGDAVSPVPTRRDSSPINFTSAANVVTASGNFFVSQDVGRLIKFNDGPGTEVYITGFTSATIVTVSAAPGVTATTGTIWYVNETALSSVFSATNSYGTSGGDNGTSAAANVVTHKRTFVGGTVGGGGVTLTEIGFTGTNSNTNVFDRDIITGGIALSPGDQPLAVCELIITYTPNASTAAGNVGTGFDSSGNMIISGLGAGPSFNNGISNVDTSGNSQNNGSLDPVNTFEICVFNTMVTLSPFSNVLGPDRSGTFIAPNSNALAGYSNGNFFRDGSSTYNTATANGTIYGFMVRDENTSDSAWEQVLTTPFVKTGVQTLTLVWRKTWQRILLN